MQINTAKQNMHISLDQVILVDSSDNELGCMDKIEAHRGVGKLHRAISVFLFNDANEVLLQQRSLQKIVGAQQWANTCCGNVRPGESYRACAERRLREELGITADQLREPLQELIKFEYFAKCNEHFSEREIDQVFIATFTGKVHQNPDEVLNSAWEKWSDIVSGACSYDFAPWFKIMLERQDLLSKIAEKLE